MANPEKDETLENSEQAEPGIEAETLSGTDAKAVASDSAESDAQPDLIEQAEAIVEEASFDEVAAAAAEALNAAKAEAADWQDKYIRLHAEWDTYRRRMDEQRKEEKARAAEKLVESLIPILDDFERTIDYANNNGEEGLLDGVKAVKNKLVDTLVKDGVEVIDPKGQAFNALEAQAVAIVPDESVPDETVAEVYQKGYRLGIKVLRPAMVTVTTGGPARVAETEEDED